jgi:hypothetical protein
MMAALALSLCLPLLDQADVSAADLFRFPSKDYADWAWDRNREYRREVVEWAATLPFAPQREEAAGRLADLDARYRCWAELYYASYFSQWGEENAEPHLRELRRLIGPLNYAAGRMPDPIPPGRRID